MKRKLIKADRYPSPSGNLGAATASRTTATFDTDLQQLAQMVDAEIGRHAS